jgi:Dyp-type peroxidase family
MRIDPDEIQMNILRSVDPAFSLFIFFRIDNVEEFRSFLNAALDKSLTITELQTGIHSERDRLHHRFRSRDSTPETVDLSPQSHSLHMNVGLTASGLRVLEVDNATCESFPEPFCEGMAARAAILGDTGASAPDYWEGYLGSTQVHGVLWWNWWDLPKSARLPGEKYRELAKRAHQTWDHIKARICDSGLNILHAEAGDANYEEFSSGDIDRVEHFGFRDGISQPWVDFGIGDATGLPRPPPGGGTPGRNGQWAPLAPGEFVLGYPDEDGLVQPWPCNSQLRHGGMYMVFRKLEQDVVGFRNFLRKSAPDLAASQLLAAQMFGRWPDGTPLIQSPGGPNQGNPRDSSRPVNDFLYQRDDPGGRRCPIGAHIRRANPRDTGGRNEARRHRLLRRGITYGGPLLPEDSPGDGRKRGVLFVALNARIDQQFEFVQSRWLNTGELLGQAGAGRDPINAPHAGQLCDSFQSPSRPAPVTHLTRFVTMRGGDYFFVPSLQALRRLANSETFPAEAPTEPLRQTAIGRLEPVNPLDPKTLFEFGIVKLLAEEAPPFVSRAFSAPQPGNIVLIGRHEDVSRVLSDEEHFSTQLYKLAISQISGGEGMIIGMASDEKERALRLKIWEDAINAYNGPSPEEIVEAAVTEILIRCSPAGRLDVVQDIGRVVPLVLAQRYYGVSGPDWLSPTAIAVNFNKKMITEVPEAWLKAAPHIPPEDVPLVSLQAWTRLAFAQVFLNIVGDRDLIAVAERSTAELFGHLDDLVEAACRLPQDGETLLACMVQQGRSHHGCSDELKKRIRLILAERIVGGTDTLNTAIVNVINHLLDHPDRMLLAKQAAQDLLDAEREARCASPKHQPLVPRKADAALPSQAAENADPDSASRVRQTQVQLDAIIGECLRFDPVASIIFRVAKRDTELGGKTIKAGALVCLLTKVAMFDPAAFPTPQNFLGPGSVGCPSRYLTFGFGPHQCRGRDIARAVLRRVLARLLSRNDLRRAAGPAGAVQYLAGSPLPVSMVVRFNA